MHKIRYYFVLIGLIFVLLLLPALPARAQSDGIAAVVNDGMISISDVNDRMRLVMVSSGLENKPDIRRKVSVQVMRVLIEEQIKLQEAERLDIAVNQEEIMRGFAAIAGQNNMPPEKFRAVLQRSGININTMEQQIRAQIAWTKIVQSQLRPRVIVTEADIDEEMARLTQNKGKKEYLVAEIALPVEDPDNERTVRKLAARLLQEIQSGKAPFFQVARQFSKAPGAPQGGNIGWVSAGQLPQALDSVLLTMDKNAVSAPIRTIDGYHLLLLRDTRIMTDENMPSAEEIRTAIGLKRLERLQGRHYMDLKAAAFVESRV